MQADYRDIHDARSGPVKESGYGQVFQGAWVVIRREGTLDALPFGSPRITELLNLRSGSGRVVAECDLWNDGDSLWYEFVWTEPGYDRLALHVAASAATGGVLR